MTSYYLFDSTGPPVTREKVLNAEEVILTQVKANSR